MIVLVRLLLKIQVNFLDSKNLTMLVTTMIVVGLIAIVVDSTLILCLCRRRQRSRGTLFQLRGLLIFKQLDVDACD